MDLSYMPGELDYKNVKKDNGSNMKREHDSVDDFEHLDPDMSPVDVQSQDFLEREKIEIETGNITDTNSKKESNSPDQLTQCINNDDLGSSSKTAGSSPGHIPLGSGDISNLNTILQINPTITEVDKDLLVCGLDADSPITPEYKYKEDPMNTTFISDEIESNTDKTEDESDLLHLENKAKENVKDAHELPKVGVGELSSMADKKADLDQYLTKSMKEADALSQYETKRERKESEKEVIPAPDEHKTEPFKTETFQSEPLDVLEQGLPDPKFGMSETDQPTLEPVKEPSELNDKSSDTEGSFKPFIAICPSNPTPTGTPTSDVSKSAKKSSLSDLDDIIGPEDVFKRIGLDAWFTPDRLHPIVEALVYWRDPKKSGVVFGGIMAILLSLCYMSLISVVAYSSLLVLTGTICFRIYKNILQAVQKTSEGHPFKEFLDLELSLPQDKVRELVDTAVVHVNAAIVELRRLFLVEDLIDSIKFGVCLWCLTYVGAIFNGMTIVILAFVALFTVPKIYENNKASIDTYIDMGRSKVAEITSKVKAAVPIGKKEPEKDKEQ